MHHSQLEYLIAVQKLQGESAGVRGITLADYMNVSASYIVKLSVYFEPIVSEELWEKCRQIRESKAMKIKSYGGKERVVGFKPSKICFEKILIRQDLFGEGSYRALHPILILLHRKAEEKGKRGSFSVFFLCFPL